MNYQLAKYTCALAAQAECNMLDMSELCLWWAAWRELAQQQVSLATYYVAFRP